MDLINFYDVDIMKFLLRIIIKVMIKLKIYQTMFIKTRGNYLFYLKILYLENNFEFN